MNDFSRLKFLLFIPLALAISGCFSQFSSPGQVVDGGLINVGLGGIKRNSTGKSLTGADISATIEDDLGVEYPVKVEGLFRAYPDHTSTYSRETLDRVNTFWNELEPYDGMWWATIRLVTLGGAPLGLSDGPATLRITSPELINTGWQYEGNLAAGIPIQILPGTTSISNDELQQYSSYRHQRSLTIRPDDLTGVSEVGGMQVKMTYNTAALSAATITPRFVPYSHDPNINIIQHTVDNGDGTNSLIAMVTNPEGFVPNADPGTYVAGNSTFADLSFAVVLVDATTLADGWNANYWFETADSYFIDQNGDVIATVAPVLDRSF